MNRIMRIIEFEGAEVIKLLYDNHIYDQDKKSIQVQHQYQDIINATAHIHLDENNCLETIMVKGNSKEIKELARYLSQNHSIKNLKVKFFQLYKFFIRLVLLVFFFIYIMTDYMLLQISRYIANPN